MERIYGIVFGWVDLEGENMGGRDGEGGEVEFMEEVDGWRYGGLEGLATGQG